MKKILHSDSLLFRLRGIWSWIEALVITLIILALSYFFNPTDPLCLNSAFPWVWFAPVLIALRYGTLKGTMSATIILLAMFYHEQTAILESAHYRHYMLGGVLLTVLCGEFYSAWASSVKRLAQLNKYIKKKLDGLNRAFYLVRLSHDRLEQNLISKPITLRSTLAELRNALADANGKLNNDVADRLMHILGQFCSMEQAGLYLFTKGKLELDPIAHIGTKRSALVPKDIMVQQCLEHGASFYAANQLTDKQESKYLAVIPMRTASNKLLGILAIEEISFWSLTNETLQNLMIMLSYFADDFWATKITPEVLKTYPNCPPRFVVEFFRLLRLKKDFGINSALSAFVVPNGVRSENIILELKHHQRGLDLYWQHKEKDRDILFVLMPFSPPNAVEGYKERFRTYLKEEFGINLDKDPQEIFLRYLQIFGTEPIPNIKQLLKYINDNK